MCYIKCPVTGRQSAHGIYRSGTFSQIAYQVFKTDLDASQYLALHDLICSIENSDDVFVCDTKENEDKNELHITSYALEAKPIVQNLDLDLYKNPMEPWHQFASPQWSFATMK